MTEAAHDASQGGATPPNGVGTDTPPSEPSIGDLLQRLDEQTRAFDGYRKKTNGELAKLRRQTAQEAEPAQQDRTPAPGATGMTESDVEAYMELGRLQGEIPAPVLEAHGEAFKALPVQQRALVATMIADAIKAGQQDRGATPATPTTRATKPAHRSSVPHPTTQSEWAKLQRTDPKAFAALMADPTFDVSSLEFA